MLGAEFSVHLVTEMYYVSLGIKFPSNNFVMEDMSVDNVSKQFQNTFTKSCISHPILIKNQHLTSMKREYFIGSHF